MDRCVWILLAVILAPAVAFGQNASLNIPDAFKNSVGIGGGGGFSYDSDAPNVSFTVNYGREINGPWGMSLAIGWDKEFRKSDGKRAQAQKFALQSGITYELTENIGVVVGFSRGLIEKEGGNNWKSAGSNDWAAGADISYSFATNDSVTVGPGLTTAYDFENNELRSEIEINVSVAF